MSHAEHRAETVAVPEQAGRGEIPRRLPRYRDVPRQRGRVVLMVLVALTAAAGVVAAVLLAVLNAGDGDGAVLSIVLALIPLPLIWFCYWWLDRYEPEPRRYKIAAFVWGGVVAVGFALAVQLPLVELTDLDDAQMATFVAPLTEEPAKGLFLLLTFLRWRRIIDGFLDGLIVAGLVGVGFAFTENIGYYAISYLGDLDPTVSGAEGATSTFVARGILSPFAHSLFLSMFGIALGLAVMVRSRTLKIALGVLGMAVSIGLHMLWNAVPSYWIDVDAVSSDVVQLSDVAPFLLVYLGMGALLFAVGTLAIIVRVQQVRTLERSLSALAERGWIHPAEIPYLSRFAYRRAARRHAKQEHGRTAGKVVGRYQRLATEVAFLHDAVMAGRTKPHGVERTYALLDAMYALRPALRLPPPMAPLLHQYRG